MTILVVEVTMKDKEPKVHVEHFFDIESLENDGYLIKAHFMLCGIHHFFKDPTVVAPKLIPHFWKTTKVYKNEFIGGYFTGRVLGMQVKLSIETIA